jgi:hypothetical protein
MAGVYACKGPQVTKEENGATHKRTCKDDGSRNRGNDTQAIYDMNALLKVGRPKLNGYDQYKGC